MQPTVHRIQIFLCLQTWMEWVLGVLGCKIAIKHPPMLVLLFIGCNRKKIYFNLLIVCEEKNRVRGKREKIVLLIIWLDSLYYFIGLYVKIKIGM